MKKNERKKTKHQKKNFRSIQGLDLNQNLRGHLTVHSLLSPGRPGPPPPPSPPSVYMNTLFGSDPLGIVLTHFKIPVSEECVRVSNRFI
jgi:hypothetical protein